MGRALLRLKPSRICESMGHYERYALPHTPGQRPAGAFVGRTSLNLLKLYCWRKSQGFSIIGIYMIIKQGG
jgi:hypothetical protein